MIGQIIFTAIAFVLFVYVLLTKLVKKNDTTYLIILGIQATGILLNLIKISFNVFRGILITSLIFTLCIVIPILVVILEIKTINISEVLRIIMAQCNLWLHRNKKAKKILADLVKKYNDSYMGHKMLAKIYEKEGGMRKAIDEYVYVLDIKKNDYKAYYRISVLLKELGRTEESTQMLRTLLKNRPYIYEASKMLRRNLFREKRI